MALPVLRNLTIYEGDTFFLVFRLRQRGDGGAPGDPVNLNGSLVQAQIRSTENSPTILATFDADHDGVGGTITLTLSSAQTSTLNDGKWDVQVIYPDGTVRTYMRGTVTMTQEITRA